MDWDELRSLADDGIEIGSHTVSHPHLTRLDDATLRLELVDSRERVEDEIGRPCRFLAYPFGEEDGRVRRAARDAGYEAAFALRTGRTPSIRSRFPDWASGGTTGSCGQRRRLLSDGIIERGAVAAGRHTERTPSRNQNRSCEVGLYVLK